MFLSLPRCCYPFHSIYGYSLVLYPRAEGVLSLILSANPGVFCCTWFETSVAAMFGATVASHTPAAPLGAPLACGWTTGWLVNINVVFYVLWKRSGMVQGAVRDPVSQGRVARDTPGRSPRQVLSAP